MTAKHHFLHRIPQGRTMLKNMSLYEIMFGGMILYHLTFFLFYVIFLQQFQDVYMLKYVD